jgi:hypothetical protein
VTATVITIPRDADSGEERVRVIVNIDTEILAAEAAMHEARAWLAQNVSPLLGVAEPELMVDEDLFWRFEIVLGLPNTIQPGSGTFFDVGHVRLEATTGNVENGDALASELRAHIASLTP